MLPDTDTETRFLKANDYNVSYALMDACKEVDRLIAELAACRETVQPLQVLRDRVNDAVGTEYWGMNLGDAVENELAKGKAARAEIERLREIIRNLVDRIDVCTGGEAELHHHTCEDFIHGYGVCTCGVREAMDAARAVVEAK